MESEKLDFSLPQKRAKSSVGIFQIVLLIVLIALASANLYLLYSSAAPERRVGSADLTAEQTKALATKLAQRNLYEQSAQCWVQYADRAGLGNSELAKTMFKAAGLFEKAGVYDKAIEYYWRSEMAEELPELKPDINSHVQICFERLGLFSALRYELMDRTALASQQSAGAKVVAEIGPEKITQADLDAFIEMNIDNQLESASAFMSADQLAEQKKQMLGQFANPQAKQQLLQSYIAQQLLYRQALEEGLAKEPKVKALIDNLTRSAMSQTMLNRQIASNVHITETDLQNYYQVNRDKFVEQIKDPNDPNSMITTQKTFEQARQQVMMSLASDKRQEVQQGYLEQLMEKYNVIIHTSEFALAQPAKP